MMDLLKSHLSSLNSFFNNIITYCYLKLKGVDTKYGYVKLLGFPIIIKAPNSKIILKKGVTLVSNSKYNPAGINHPVILATLAENAIIEIGAIGFIRYSCLLSKKNYNWRPHRTRGEFECV